MNIRNFGKKLVLAGVVIVLVVLTYNTAFYLVLKSSSFLGVVRDYIQESNTGRKLWQDKLYLEYRYLGKKKYSWTGRRTEVVFDVSVAKDKKVSIMKVTIEKIDGVWRVVSIVGRWKGTPIVL